MLNLRATPGQPLACRVPVQRVSLPAHMMVNAINALPTAPATSPGSAGARAPTHEAMQEQHSSRR
jgi:hypothetical protein